MKSRTLSLAVIVTVVVLATGPVAAAVTGSPDIDVTLSDNTVAPGEETTLDVVLVNSGDLDSGSAQNPSLDGEVTTARGLTVALGGDDAPISVTTSRQSLGSLSTGAPTTVSFDISVAENANPGNYRVPIRLAYEYTNFIDDTGEGTRVENSVDRTRYVSVDVTDDATFNVTNVESGARVGSTGTVAVTVENTGRTAAQNAAATLTSHTAELGVGGGTESARFVDAWEPGERRTFQYRVSAGSDAEPEPYEFGFSVAFDDPDGVRTQSVERSVGIAPAPEQTFSVLNTTSNVAIGNTGTYELTLRNDGPVTVDDTTVTVSSRSSDITFGSASSTTQFVGTWAPGENQTVAVDATVSNEAELRSYALSSSVQYDDPEGDSGTDTDLSLGLQPTPEQRFELSDVETSLRAGEDGTLEATLTNDGPRTVESVVVNWASEHSNLSPQETQYAVGTLEAGDEATVSFGVDASDNARAGPRQFDFTASYRDDAGDRQESDTLEIQAPVDASEDEFRLESTNTSVGAGQSGTIDVTITNTREVALTDISAKLFADSPISVSDSDAYVSELGPGQSETLRFAVSAGGSAMEKAYPVSLDFQYEEPDGDTPTSDTYQVAIDVTTSGGGGLPLVAIGAVLFVGVLAIGGYVRFR